MSSPAHDERHHPLPAVRRRAWLRRAGLLVLSVVCARIIVGLVGAVEWRAVYDAMSGLHLWQLGLLVLVLVVRQVFNAMPLALFIDGLSVFRATVSDQAATLTSMVAPPPSDMLLRISILRSWGIAPSLGLAASTMNTLAFYINRFLAPAIGFLVILPVRFVPADALVALVCLVVAGTILVLTVKVVRSESVAERVGLSAGRLASRVRKQVDPVAWATATLDFRTHIAGRLRRCLPRALAALAVMVLLDALLLLLALRFVGIHAADLSAAEVVSTFLVLFPMTLFPLAGLGILDAAVVAALTSVGGLELENQVVAGLVVWRVVTLLTPMLLGGIALGYWRRTSPGATPA
jgi:putative heme transporter